MVINVEKVCLKGTIYLQAQIDYLKNILYLKVSDLLVSRILLKSHNILTSFSNLIFFKTLYSAFYDCARFLAKFLSLHNKPSFFNLIFTIYILLYIALINPLLSMLA